MASTERPPIPCTECGGVGREWRPAEFSGRTPWAEPIKWHEAVCERCEGTGDEPCLYCGREAPATEEVEGDAYCRPHAADARQELRRRLPAREVA